MNDDTNQSKERNELQHPSLSEQEQELIKQLMKKSAQLHRTEKEIQANEKQINHIEKSKTWKWTAPFRKLAILFPSKKQKQAQQIRALQAELKTSRKELYSTREELHEAMLDDRNLNSTKLLAAIRDQAEEGKLIDYIQQAVQQKKLHQANYNEALRYAARIVMNEPLEYKQLAYTKVLEGLNIDEIPEFVIREGLTEPPVALKQAASFRGSLNMRIRQNQLAGPLPEWLLDNKKDAYHFITNLNIRKPWTSDENYTHTTIPKNEEVVIKPVDSAGSRGVYLVYNFNDIIDVKRSTKLDSWDRLKASMEKDLESGWVAEDQWYMEELILENKAEKTPASDLKFYCFYGNVGLILEISRFPELNYCWWTAAGERLHTGKYEENPYKGRGVSQSEIEMASFISAEIPAPFMRIDFLRSEDGLVFGEFTPKPGNYDEFDQPVDQWLGDCFLEAQGRLYEDLMNGKSFSGYRKLKEIVEHPK
ncbi:ATP-grasp fold amidoligase family protein [Shouchella shacheensis]|uniref:ATP-grasp fold amidoligase family protein n=1 Tax=Shouchella shacheensis TaxID=1649580 RepID=UPI001FE02A28|nr:ATP-grasp fold amidoligase family protein [Shouchella shacheensis]